MGKVLYTLAHGVIMPEIRIVYTVKDTQGAKNRLLAKAVEDSRQKALILSQAAGVSLGDVMLIDYSWGELEIVSSPIDRMMDKQMACSNAASSYSMDIDPDDIDLTDTVTVVWSIA